MALGFNITDFRASMDTQGILRSHSYMVRINAPTVLSNYDASRLTLRADSLNMPGINLMTQDAIYRYGYGVAEVMPYNVAFSPVTISFIVDKSASQYTFFNLWMNYIFSTNMQSGINGVSEDLGSYPFEVEYKNNYATDMNIFVYNENIDKVIELTFQEAYPVLMQDTMLNWNEQNAPIRLQMTFAYKTFYMKEYRSFDYGRLSSPGVEDQSIIDNAPKQPVDSTQFEKRGYTIP